MPGTNVQISSTDDGAHWTAPALVDLAMYFDMNPGPGTGMQFTDASPWPGRIAFIGYYGANEVHKMIIMSSNDVPFGCPVINTDTNTMLFCSPRQCLAQQCSFLYWEDMFDDNC